MKINIAALNSVPEWIKKNKIKSLIILIVLFFLYQLLTIPYFSIMKLDKNNPDITAIMKQRMDEKKQRSQKYRIRQKWVPIYRISEHLRRAIIVAEDGRFMEHSGIDWFEVKESFEKNWEAGKIKRGGSTITQQVAKNLYLSTSRSPLRKIKEVIISFIMENHLTKGRILEIYLNIIEWGDGIFGIEAASNYYFGKSAASLDRDESVRLAAVIPSPIKHKPTDNSKFVIFRKNIILERMNGRGW